MRHYVVPTINVRRIVTAASLGLCLAMAPAFYGSPIGVDTALAKSEGKGGGNGRGGGNGKSDSGSSKGKSAESRNKSGSGKGSARGAKSTNPLDSLAEAIFGEKKSGKSKHGVKSESKAQKSKQPKTEVETETEVATVEEKSKLPGKLNAAHASATARANAAPNSAVGQIAAYEKAKTEALASGDEEAIAEAEDMLRDLARKDLTAGQIATLDKMLGIEPPAPAKDTGEVAGEDLAGSEAPVDEIAQDPAGDGDVPAVQ